MIPQTFYEWHQCITEKCGIQLSVEFIQQRLKVLEDNAQPDTMLFKKMYGAEHLNMIIAWYKEAATLINQ